MAPDAILSDRLAEPGTVAPPPSGGLLSYFDSHEIREAVLRRDLQRLTAERDGLRAALDRQLRARREVCGDALPLEQASARLAAKDALIRALYRSTSWRITAPLRALAALLGRSAPGMEDAIARTDVTIVDPVVDLTSAAATVAASDCVVRRRPEGNSPGEVLVVADHLPLFDRQSGGLRLTTLIGLIAKLGWTVTFGSYGPEKGPGVLATEAGRRDYEAALRAIGVTSFVYGPDGIRQCVTAAGGRMRYAFVSFPVIAHEVIPLLRIHCPWARIIFDTVDLHFLRMQREAALLGRPGLFQAAEAMRATELACLRSADVTVAVTETERHILLDLVPEAVVETLPNIFKIPELPPPGPQGRRDLLFLGGFWHTPNADAVVWFADHIWPLIRAQAPGLTFRIAGADPTPSVIALGERPGIEVLGYVRDLTPLFDAARVFVAPLRFGAGMKGKVGQSLIHGLPVVTTPIGAEGMALEDGVHIAVADNPDDFADRVLALLRDDALWRGLQQQGHRAMAATLSEAAIAPRVEALFHA